ncbi:AMP-binding protein [Streptomyces sp. NPDC002763]|uniref:AMP-binding protein n=1 Tax=Streptomyces sp. NPDC002763 TaxID=3154427 RepID=UPI003319FA52
MTPRSRQGRPPRHPRQVERHNETARPVTAGATLVDLIDAAALGFPDFPAVRTAEGLALTHADLALASDRLARGLAGTGVGRGTLVAVLADHTPDAVVAIHAAVRAGATYVPLDVNWPVQRIHDVLRSMSVRHLVVTAGLELLAFEVGAAVPCLRTVVVGKPSHSPRRPGDSGDGSAAVAPHDGTLRIRRFDGPRPAPVPDGAGLLWRRLARHGLTPSPVPEGYDPRAVLDGVLSGVGSVALVDVVRELRSVRVLREVLHLLAASLPSGAEILVCDVIGPSGPGPSEFLRIPPGWWDAFAGGYPGLGCEVRPRKTDEHVAGQPCEDLDRACYDVVLTVPPSMPASVVTAESGTPELPWEAADLPQVTVTDPPGGDDLALVVFTPGSTSAPKAVAIRHRSLVNLVDWFNRRNGVGPDDVLLQSTPLSFDLSVYDLFGLVAAGGCLLMLPSWELTDPDLVHGALTEHAVTLWNSAPGAFRQVLDAAARAPARHRSSLRRVFLSRDRITPDVLPALRQEFPEATLVALGGTTETTVWSIDAVVDVTGGLGQGDGVLYGRPMQNVRYYVLRDDFSPCAIDEAGELYIAGDCVAAGYIQDPQLTEGRFLPDPWDVEGGRMHRTGDLARWTSSGRFEFLGRTDARAIVGGYRISLGQVERTAEALDDVDEAVALTIGPPDNLFLALAIRTRVALTTEDVLHGLGSRLPGHMLPAFVWLAGSLPVAATGRADRIMLRRILSDGVGRTTRFGSAERGLVPPPRFPQDKENEA